MNQSTHIHRVVVVAVGRYGDVLPLLAVARRLRDRWDAADCQNRHQRREVVFLTHTLLLNQIHSCGGLPEMDDKTKVISIAEPQEYFDEEEAVLKARTIRQQAGRRRGMYAEALPEALPPLDLHGHSNMELPTICRSSLSTADQTPVAKHRSHSVDSAESCESFRTAASFQDTPPQGACDFFRLTNGCPSGMPPKKTIFVVAQLSSPGGDGLRRRCRARSIYRRAPTYYAEESQKIAEALVYNENLQPTTALVTNLFGCAAIHATHLLEVPAFVVSPCGPAKCASPQIISDLNPTFLSDDALRAAKCADERDQTPLTCKANTPLVRADSADRSGPVSKVVNKTIQRMASRRPFVVSLNDINHWMWRLCLKEQADVRESLGMKRSLFEKPFDDSPDGVPAVPLLYLMHPLFATAVDSWPSTCSCVGFTAPFNARDFQHNPPPPTMRSRTAMGGPAENVSASPLKAMRSGGEPFGLVHMAKAFALHKDFMGLPRRVVDDWLSDEREHDKCFAFVTFGSMHSDASVTVGPLDELIKVLQEASEILGLRFLLHIPSPEVQGRFGVVPNVAASTTKVLVMLGIMNNCAILEHSGCLVLICHGGAGIAAHALRCRVPMVLVPMMFDHYAHTKTVERRGGGLSSYSLSMWFRAAAEPLQGASHLQQIAEGKWDCSWAAKRLAAVVLRVLAYEPCRVDRHRSSLGRRLRRPQAPPPDGAEVVAEVVFQAVVLRGAGQIV